jgi:hypothetical protein
MRVGWGEPLESWRCLAAGIAKDGSFDINLLARYICERLKRIIVTYPNFCAFNSRPRNDPLVSRVVDRLADPHSSRMYQGSFEISAKRNWVDYLSGLLLSQQYADHVPFAEINGILNLGVFSGSELPLLQAVLPENGVMTCVDPFGSEKLRDFIARDAARDHRIDFVQAAIAGREGTRSFQNLGGATTAVS